MNIFLKKVFAGALTLSTLFALAACGGSTTDSASSQTSTTGTSATADASGESTTGESVKLVIGASPTPHAEILTAIKPVLEKEGIEIEIVEYNDYIQPNTALSGGDLDANYFQHEPYLLNFNEGNGTDLVSAGFIHYEPMGIYPGKSTDITDIPEGATVVIPADGTNHARALLLLEANGFFTLKEGVGIEATSKDIVDNPKNVKIIEVAAEQVPAALPDADFGVANGNFALGAGIADKVITSEDENSAALDFANIIAVRAGDETRPEIQKLVEALKSDTAREFIQSKYGDTVKVYED